MACFVGTYSKLSQWDHAKISLFLLNKSVISCFSSFDNCAPTSTLFSRSASSRITSSSSLIVLYGSSDSSSNKLVGSPLIAFRILLCLIFFPIKSNDLIFIQLWQPLPKAYIVVAFGSPHLASGSASPGIGWTPFLLSCGFNAFPWSHSSKIVYSLPWMWS